MKTFLVLFKCAENSKAHLHWLQMTPEMKNDHIKRGTEEVAQWTQKYQDRIVFDGGSVAETTKFVDNGGIHDTPSQVGSFLVVKANSPTEAAELFIKHPHFAFFPGDGVEVIECRSRNLQD